jgi:hypothetical protein
MTLDHYDHLNRKIRQQASTDGMGETLEQLDDLVVTLGASVGS